HGRRMGSVDGDALPGERRVCGAGRLGPSRDRLRTGSRAIYRTQCLDAAPHLVRGLRSPFAGSVGECTMDPISPLPALDRATLTPLVRQALRRVAVEIVDWHTT